MIDPAKLLAYEEAVGEAWIAALEAVPEQDRREPAFASALGLAAHVVAAQLLWLARLAPQSAPEAPEVFPTWSLPELRERAAGARRAWAGYLGSVDVEAEATRRVGYANSRGESFEDQAQEIWLHVYGHSHHHRGQLASLLRVLGQEPPRGDFIFFLRSIAR